MLLLFLSCATDRNPPPFGGDDSTPPADPWPEIYELAGSLTWSLNTGNSQTSCSYVETYTAIEDLSHPWTCPECNVQFAADVKTDDDACYRAVNGSLPEREYLGFNSKYTLYRHIAANFPLDLFGYGRLDTDAIEFNEYLTSDDGSSLHVEGTLDRTVTTADGWNGFAPPGSYACGWPKADPPPFEGEWAYHVNQTIPDGWFKDTCDEPVRLHDLAGSYLVIDVSAVDCAPCQLMASEEAAFTAAMPKDGIDVRSVTLLAPSLSAILDDTPIETLETWKTTYGVSGVVLADRGWGYAIPEHFLGTKNYPTWTVISPDLRAIAIGSGFESYQLIENAIRADLD